MTTLQSGWKLKSWPPLRRRPYGVSSGDASYADLASLRFLVSNNGKQFDNDSFRDFCSQLEIRNHYSSPAHPQANGQVEVMNQSLLKIIKTRLNEAKGIWPEEFPSILWAYRTMARTPTGETSF